MRCLRFIVCMGFMVASLDSIAEQKQITVPVPNTAISENVTVIYCDTIVGAYLGKLGEDVNHKQSGNKEELYANVDDKQWDRLIIEISQGTLYVHHREDFEEGKLFWGHSSPLEIQSGSAQQSLIALGYDRRPKSAAVTVFTLNRITGVGLWTVTRDTLWAKDMPSAKNYPAATAAYLSCGSRKK